MNRKRSILPPRLKFGDTIGIVSPCDVKLAEKTEPYLEGLEKLGFNIKRGKRLYKSDWGYADSDIGRAEDFNSMIKDPDVKMVFFGGGEVASEVLPLIDYKIAAENPKIYCSYSDGTSILNAIYANSGIITYHGQTPRTFGELSDYNYSQFKSMLMEESSLFHKNSTWTTIRGGRAEGILVGGYTQNIAVLADSPYMNLDLNLPYILFLEDYEWFSSDAAVARYLACISQSRFFKAVKGMIFGQYRIGEQEDILPILERFSEKHKIPLVKTDDFGHGNNNAIFPIGVYAFLDGDNQSLEFEY